MSLEARLAAMIAAGGSISIARYMDLCLHDRDFGYYATRPRLGADGDFITAPHVSQMVGELLGLWACEVFRSLGRPRSVRLVDEMMSELNKEPDNENKIQIPPPPLPANDNERNGGSSSSGSDPFGSPDEPPPPPKRKRGRPRKYPTLN